MSRTFECETHQPQTAGLNKKDLKLKAQEMVMDKLSEVFYNSEFREGEVPQDLEIEIKRQMERVAKLMGFNEAWTN